MNTSEGTQTMTYYHSLQKVQEGQQVDLERGAYAITAHGDDEAFVEFVGIADAAEVAELIAQDFDQRVTDIAREQDRMCPVRYCVFHASGTAVTGGGVPVAEVMA